MLYSSAVTLLLFLIPCLEGGCRGACLVQVIKWASTLFYTPRNVLMNNRPTPCLTEFPPNPNQFLISLSDTYTCPNLDPLLVDVEAWCSIYIDIL
jgi:hypothetical protein